MDKRKTVKLHQQKYQVDLNKLQHRRAHKAKTGYKVFILEEECGHMIFVYFKFRSIYSRYNEKSQKAMLIRYPPHSKSQ